MKVPDSPTIPLDENIAKKIMETCCKEDLIWGPEYPTTSDETIYLGLGLPIPISQELKDDVPVWITNEYLVSKEVMENYNEKLKRINEAPADGIVKTLIEMEKIGENYWGGTLDSKGDL